MKIQATFLVFFFLFFNAFGQDQLSYTTAKGTNYLAYFPSKYQESDDSLPLLLFLHGLGEKNNNIEVIKRYGPPKMIANGEWSKELPFIVISPQLPMDYRGWSAALVDEILQHLLHSYRVDEKRVYLTGLSLGGIGTWNYALHHPEKLAAIIPVCGNGNPTLACNLKNLPVWAFHGDQDKIVPPEGSKKMIAALKDCADRENRSDTRITLYPGVKHDSWTTTYNNSEIYQWLLSHTNEAAISIEPLMENLPKAPDVPDNFVALKTVCTLPKAVFECSGLQYYKGDLVWAHNDSGNSPVIYQIDTTGKILQFKTITNAANYDWEDLTKDNTGNLYIGDFGNNKNNRKSLQIYKIPNPEQISENRIRAEVISFNYSDQKEFPPAPLDMNFDMEALIAISNDLYLFSKNRTTPFSGYTKVYQLPQEPGEYTASLVDSIYLDNRNMLENWITGADISPDGKNIILLSSNKLWLITNFEGNKFSQGDIIPIPLPAISQKEGITFINNTEILIADEKIKNIFGGKLYRVDLTKYLQ